MSAITLKMDKRQLSTVDSQLREGYKQSEVGVIPEEWEVKTLGDVFEFKNGLNKEKKYFGEGTPIINYMDVYKNNALTANDLRGKVTVTKNELKAYEVRKGDVFFTRTSETVDEIGITSVITEKLEKTVFSGFILRARPKNNWLDALYKKYCFSSENVRKEITSKSSYTTRALTNGRLLSKVQIPLPPLPEQQAIASALSDVDALIATLEQLITKKRNIKQGAMQQLLTGKKRLPGFGGGWVLRKLGELLDYEQPTEYIVTDTEYDDNNDTPVLTAGKTFILGHTNEETGIFRNLPVIIFDDFTTTNKYVTFPFKVKSSAMKILKLKDKKANLGFVFEKMQLINFHLGDHKRYWISEYQNLEVEIPQSEEQQAIAQILSDMDTEIEALKQKRDKYKAIKQGMMQELLTGKTRLAKEDKT